MTSPPSDLPRVTVPVVDPDGGKSQQPLRMLSLTGGGFRGLFTASVLLRLCELSDAQGRLDSCFQIFAGTSIGALMACALAVGIEAQQVLEAIEKHGPDIFLRRFSTPIKKATTGAAYGSDVLSKAIRQSLGEHADRLIQDIDVPLIVPAVDWSTGQARIFMSHRLGGQHASATTLHDVCMASAAAPTYFASFEVDGHPMLDGGLVANNPDTVALLEIQRRWPSAIDRLEVLSIGTAGAQSIRPPEKADKGQLGWAPALALFMIDVQEATAASQAQRLLGKRYLRVNHVDTTGQPAFTRLDLADEQARRALRQAGVETAARAYQQNRAFIDRMFSNLRRS